LMTNNATINLSGDREKCFYILKLPLHKRG
jgi:hypothetical protein